MNLWLKENNDYSMEELGRFYYEEGEAIFSSYSDEIDSNWFSIENEEEVD